MTPTPPLRPTDAGSAQVEQAILLRGTSPVRAAAAVAAAAAVFLAVVLLSGVGRLDPTVPSFLGEALGPEKAEAPLERTPATGIDVRIQDEGYTVSHAGASLSVVSEDVGAAEWQRHAHGVTRQTGFGAETIVVDDRKTEEFLTVAERQGDRTWRWKLATRLQPRLGSDGTVSFLDPTRHLVTSIAIDPVRILDANGKDVTPDGLRWGLEEGDNGWWLTLELDDADLPLPYVIDPAANYPTPLNLRSTASSAARAAGRWTAARGPWTRRRTTSPRRTPPAGTASTPARPRRASLRRSRRRRAEAASSSTRRRCDGLPRGNWSFTVVTDIPNATFVGGDGRAYRRALERDGRRAATFTPTADDPDADGRPGGGEPAHHRSTNEDDHRDVLAPCLLDRRGRDALRRLLAPPDRRHHSGTARGGSSTSTSTTAPHSYAPGCRRQRPGTRSQSPSYEPGRPILRRRTRRSTTTRRRAGPSAGTTPPPSPARRRLGDLPGARRDRLHAHRRHRHDEPLPVEHVHVDDGEHDLAGATDRLGGRQCHQHLEPLAQLTLTRDVTAPTGQTLSLVGGPYYTSHVRLADERATVPTAARASIPPRACTSVTRPRL